LDGVRIGGRLRLNVATVVRSAIRRRTSALQQQLVILILASVGGSAVNV